MSTDFTPNQFHKNVKFINNYSSELFIEIAKKLNIPLKYFNLVKMDNKTPETTRNIEHGVAAIKAIDERNGKRFNIRVSAMTFGEESIECKNEDYYISQVCKFHRDKIIGKDYRKCDIFIYYKNNSIKQQIIYMVKVSNEMWNDMLKKVEGNPCLDYSFIPFSTENRSYTRHNFTKTPQEEIEKIPSDKLKKFLEGKISNKTFGSSGVSGRNTEMKLKIILSGETHDLPFSNIQALFRDYGTFFKYKNYNSFKSAIAKRKEKGGFLNVSENEYKNKRLFQAFTRYNEMILNFDKIPIDKDSIIIAPKVIAPKVIAPKVKSPNSLPLSMGTLVGKYIYIDLPTNVPDGKKNESGATPLKSNSNRVQYPKITGFEDKVLLQTYNPGAIEEENDFKGKNFKKSMLKPPHFQRCPRLNEKAPRSDLTPFWYHSTF
jgi:hypothetical protein